jgi:hypothetical protein
MDFVMPNSFGCQWGPSAAQSADQGAGYEVRDSISRLEIASMAAFMVIS